MAETDDVEKSPEITFEEVDAPDPDYKVTLGTSVTLDVAAAVLKLARKHHTTKSAIIRTALVKWLKSKGELGGEEDTESAAG